MVQIHCTTPQQIDAVWRLLSHVPDEDFVEAEVFLCGEFHYLVIRSPETGEQTTTRPADRPACTFPAA
jgi:hypothetical protein